MNKWPVSKYLHYFNRHIVPSGIICIEDKCDGNQMSVTNNAENVVIDMLEHYGDCPIVYRDTEGRWDELKHDGKKFTGFRALNAETMREAIELL